MPRLRILAGSSMSDLVPIHADSGVPVPVSSDAFEGQLAVFIKGFTDEDGQVRDSEYFRKRSGVTWSIQMQGVCLAVLFCRCCPMAATCAALLVGVGYGGQLGGRVVVTCADARVAGRFLKEYTADDLLFGNVFDRPLKLPWIFSVAVKFMKYVLCSPSRPRSRS